MSYVYITYTLYIIYGFRFITSFQFFSSSRYSARLSTRRLARFCRRTRNSCLRSAATIKPAIQPIASTINNQSSADMLFHEQLYFTRRIRLFIPNRQINLQHNTSALSATVSMLFHFQKLRDRLEEITS